MPTELIAALIGLAGIIIGVIPTYIFMRQKTTAEIDKIRAETDKIREETKAITENQGGKFSSEIKPQFTYFGAKPFKFLAEKKNRYPIPSEFILWEKCTILLWVYISPRGQGIRAGDGNKYLIGHMTDVVNKEQGWPFYNRFSLGILKGDTWSVIISSNKSQEKHVNISDGLDPGWHQFYVSWNRSKPILDFAIDLGQSGRNFSIDIANYWPERVAENVILGSWVSEWKGHYSETEVYKVEIYAQYLELEDDVTRMHFKSKPI